MNLFPLAAVIAVSYITYRVLASTAEVDNVANNWSRANSYVPNSYAFPPGSTIVSTKIGSNLWELETNGGGKMNVTSMGLGRYTSDPRYTVIQK